MKNRFKGKCENCGKDVPPKEGYWRMYPKQTRLFMGLRCKDCGITTKENIKIQKAKGILI